MAGRIVDEKTACTSISTPREFARQVTFTVLQKLTPRFLQAPAKQVSDEYDEKIISDSKGIIEELEARKKRLHSHFLRLEGGYKEIEGYYSIRKLISVVDQIAEKVERKRHDHLILSRPRVAAQYEWKIADDKRAQPQLFEKVLLKIRELDADREILEKYKRLREWIHIGGIVRAAAKRYVQECNRALEAKTSQPVIDQYIIAGQLFNCFSDISYSKRDNKFICQHNSKQFSPRVAIGLLNHAIKTLPSNFQGDCASVCLNNEITKPEYKNFYSFNRAGTVPIETKSAYIEIERQLESKIKEGLSIVGKYVPILNEEKQAIDNLCYEMDKLQTIFRDIEEDFEAACRHLDIEEFKRREKATMQVLYDEFHVISSMLEVEMKQKVKCSTLCFFKNINDKMTVAQQALDKKIAREQKNILECFDVIKEKFDGKSVSEKRNQYLSEIYEMRNLSREAIIKAAEIQSRAEYMHAHLVLKGKMAIIRGIQFLQSIFTPKNLKDFWQTETNGIACCGFFVGGCRIRFEDGSCAIVPQGIAQLYGILIRSKDLSIDDDAVVDLYEEIRKCANERIQQGNAMRKNATTRCLYDLLSRLPSDTLVEDVHIFSFIENVSKITNSHHVSLVSEGNYEASLVASHLSIN